MPIDAIPASRPADRSTVDRRGVEPRFPVARPVSSRWTSSPFERMNRIGTEPRSPASIPRIPTRVPGAGIEPAASAFRARRHYHQQLPRIREGGFEPPPPDSKSGSLPVSRFPRAPRGSRTRLSDLGSPRLTARPGTHQSSLRVRDRGVEPRSPGWKPGVVPLDQSRGLQAEGEGVEPSRLIARPGSSRVPSPIGLPFPSSSSGGRNRTCVLPVNSRARTSTNSTGIVASDSRDGRIRTGGLNPP